MYVTDGQTLTRMNADEGVPPATTKGKEMIRRTAVAALAAGLAMTASVGLAGAGGAAFAASPALKIEPDSQWTMRFNFGNGADACQIDTFAANDTFTADNGDHGKWSGGGHTVSMTWIEGGVILTFSGTYTATPKAAYVGKFGGTDAGDKGRLIKGAIASC